MAGFFFSLVAVGLPIAAIIFFIVSLVRFLSGRKSGCDTREMKRRKILLVVSSVSVLGAILLKRPIPVGRMSCSRKL